MRQEYFGGMRKENVNGAYGKGSGCSSGYLLLE